MLKKVAAVLLLAGLVLPYGCDLRPVAQLWAEPTGTFLFGIPVLGAAAYALHVLLPPLARFHERHGATLHGVLRAVVFALFGGLLYAGLDEPPKDTRGWLAYGLTIAACAGLLLFNQGRGSKTQRLPLLLLVVASFLQVVWFVTFVGSGMQYGGWIFSAGYFLAVWLEVKALATAPKVMHGG